MKGSPRALGTRWALAALARESSSTRAGSRQRVRGAHRAEPFALAAGFDRHGALLGARRVGGALAAVEVGSVSPVGPAYCRIIMRLRRTRTARRRDPLALRCGLSLLMPGGAPLPGWIAACRRELSGLVDYVVLNPGRAWPEAAAFLDALTAEVRVQPVLLTDLLAPMLVKLPSAWQAGDAAVLALARACLGAGAAGVLLSAEGVAPGAHLARLRLLRASLGAGVCLASVGGVREPGDVIRRLRAGATLVQAHGALRRGRRMTWLAQLTGSLAAQPCRDAWAWLNAGPQTR